VTLERIVESRIVIDQTRLLTVRSAHIMDTVRQKGGAADSAMIKGRRPEHGLPGDDWAIQATAGRRYQRFGTTRRFGDCPFLRIADGPDEVYRKSGRPPELKKHAGA
jgi:acyl-CoA dehydrogenase